MHYQSTLKTSLKMPFNYKKGKDSVKMSHFNLEILFSHISRLRVKQAKLHL